MPRATGHGDSRSNAAPSPAATARASRKRDAHGHAEPVEQRAGDEMPVRPAPQIPPDAIPLPIVGDAVSSGKHRAEQPDADQKEAHTYGMAPHPAQQPGRGMKPYAASPFGS